MFHLRIHVSVLFLLLTASAVFPQTANSGASQGQNIFPIMEKEPTPKDPRYMPSILPPALRDQLKPGEKSYLSPTGEIDLQSIIEAQQQKKKKSSRMERYIEQRDEDLIRKNEYLFMEQQLSSQFGVNAFPTDEYEEEYTETSGRRFQIIFFTSLPITLAISYGIISAAINSRVFTGPQTALLGFMGISSSSLIGWYDHVQWKKELRRTGYAFPEENSYAGGIALQKLQSQNYAGGLHPNSDGNAVFAAGYTFTLR